MHGRLFPKVNTFTYGIYYLAFPLSRMNRLADGWRFGVNRPGLLGFYERDYGPRDGGALEPWIRKILSDHNIHEADGDIVLIAMPRVFGYVFNPISFWLCLDKEGALRAVLCEVCNTFGENHSYLCVHADRRVIGITDVMETEKLFHVSPFLKREGSYRFRFDWRAGKFGAWVDYYDETGKKQLVTALTGDLVPYSRIGLRHAFWRYPLVTLKTISLIHWQAGRLFLKKMRYVPKPPQKDEKLSTAGDITEI